MTDKITETRKALKKYRGIMNSPKAKMSTRDDASWELLEKAVNNLPYLLEEIERLQKIEARARLLIGGIAMSLPPDKRAELEALQRDVFGG